MQNAATMKWAGIAAAMAVFAGCSANAGDQAQTSKTAESSVVTNENGCVQRTFVESSITTNANLVTEHRRETRTNMDVQGNVLETTTSEYAQSYGVGDVGMTPLSASRNAPAEPPAVADSFLGLKFGETFGGTNCVEDADEPALLRAEFTPKKPLAGFDDYYVYVTPKTRKVAKVFACAKNAVEPGARWRRHYLIEALEKRYRTVARLCSFSLPYYAFDVGPGRYVTACLAGANDTYETVVAAWDENVIRTGAEERNALREEARKAAAANRTKRVDAAADAF